MTPEEDQSPSSPLRLLVFGAILLSLFVTLIALGHWQVERRAWKLSVIEQVERHHAAEPVAAPGPDHWAQLGDEDVYRRVVVQGRFDHERETCVQAVTVLGPGFWVLTPFETSDFIVLVNRGFVPAEACDPAARPQGQVEGGVDVVGRLRLSEPVGAFLRENDPAGGRWYSRDVVQIAAAHGLAAERVAPWFLDAEASVEGGPVGGLTVMQFRNHHLLYALTWFGLAALVALAAVLVTRREWRLRHR